MNRDDDVDRERPGQGRIVSGLESSIELEHLGACPICGETSRVLLHTGLTDKIFDAPGTWQLWRCSSCRCGYLDPRPTRDTIGAAYRRYFPRSAAADEPPPQRLARLRLSLGNGYLNSRYGYSFEPATRLGRFVVPLFPKRRWNTALIVRGLAKPAGRPRLLDVGFGDGSFLRTMRAAGWDVAGVEADEAAVSAARATGLDVELGGVEDARYPAGSFDAITLSHVLEHLHEPVPALAACHRLLRPRGVLWLATPNLDSPGHRRFGRDWFGLDPPRHLVLFQRRAVNRVLAQAGFAGTRHLRSYRADLVLAGSEALATEGDAASAVVPASRGLRRLARMFDAAALVHPAFGEEIVTVARKPAQGTGGRRKIR